MTNANAALVRRPYERYAVGDDAALLGLVDPDLEWTYLDPAEVDPEPQVCHGRHELEHALERQRSLGLRSEPKRQLPDRKAHRRYTGPQYDQPGDSSFPRRHRSGSRLTCPGLQERAPPGRAFVARTGG